MSEYIQVTPQFIPAADALRIGSLVRQHAEGKQSGIYPIYPIRVDGGVYDQSDINYEILEFAEQIEPMVPVESHGMPADAICSVTTLTNGRHLPLHRDLPGGNGILDQRFMINMSPENTHIFYIPEPTDTPEVKEIQKIELEPGDGYYLDNREVQLWHATPLQENRTMLQFLYEDR